MATSLTRESLRSAVSGPVDLASRLTERERTRRRQRRFLLTLGIVAVGAGLFWRPMQRELLAILLLRADAPAESVIKELVEKYRDRSLPLRRLWDSNKLPHRLAVLNYLRIETDREGALLKQMDSVLLAAARDADLTVKELGFAVLSWAKHPDLASLAAEQLRDADPAVRALGLDYLRRVGDSRLLPSVVRLLDDWDLRVVACAGNLLQKWTGQDFGIRLSNALPTFDRPDVPAPSSPNDLDALRQGVQRWKAWWREHEGDYPKPPDEAAHLRTLPPRLSAPKFSLEDLNGKRVQSAGFRGKAMLLYFLDARTDAAKRELPIIAELHRQNTRRLVVVAVSLDATAAERDHELEHQHDHGGGHHTAPNSAEIRLTLQHLAATSAIPYPILIDEEGIVGHRFNVQTVPTSVLIDGNGYIRRRFVGTRTIQTWEAMLNELFEHIHP